MRLAVFFLAMTATILADVSGRPGGMNPYSARIVTRHQLADQGNWSNFDLSYDGSTVGLTRGDNTIVFYDVVSGRETAKIERAGQGIHDTAISGDGIHYALTLNGGAVEVYSSREKKMVGSFETEAGFC
jgi:hypothetical protein